ncbi:BNR-4 repeat-containing protein [Arthrobacter sp. ISL-30]|nr:BNR-4 repeat-containing protein [Arthrobacter sp. ISL-30]
MTYPRFALHPDGTLFCMYRDGASGNGDVYLNRKNVGAACTQLGKLADGKTNNENPDESGFLMDADATLAVSFTWSERRGPQHQRRRAFHQVHGQGRDVEERREHRGHCPACLFRHHGTRAGHRCHELGHH